MTTIDFAACNLKLKLWKAGLRIRFRAVERKCLSRIYFRPSRTAFSSAFHNKSSKSRFTRKLTRLPGFSREAHVRRRQGLSCGKEEPPGRPDCGQPPGRALAREAASDFS